MKRYRNANENIHTPEELNRAVLARKRSAAPRRAVALLTAAVLLCGALAATAALLPRGGETPPTAPVETADAPKAETNPPADTTVSPDTTAPSASSGEIILDGHLPFRLTEAEYPAQAQIPIESDYGENGNYPNQQYWQDMQAWMDTGRNRVAENRRAVRTVDIDQSYIALMRQFLTADAKTAGQNRLLSPINLYLALSMLTELTEGNSRAQLLTLLDAPDLETARSRANLLWGANYLRDGATTSVLASSLWLNETVNFRPDTLDRLAEHYYAESYQGKMGSPELDAALRAWLNEQTGGLLSDAVKDVSLDARTVLALATTIFYEARWTNTFNSANNTTAPFHAAAGDETTVFMNRSAVDTYYWGENYSAVSLALENNGGRMWFFLPDEGVTPDALLAGDAIYNVALERDAGENKTLIVNLSVPKFDVSAKFDLNNGLKALGITDVWSAETADFSPVTDDGIADEIYLSRAEHAVRVKIDEDGCPAAAYTLMAMAGMGAPPKDEVDFVLDRPFVFLLVSSSNTPLFAGVVETVG